MEGPGALHRGTNPRRQTEKLRSADADAVKLSATAHPGYRVTEEFRLNASSMIIQRVLPWLVTVAIIDSFWRVPPTAIATGVFPDTA